MIECTASCQGAAEGAAEGVASKVSSRLLSKKWLFCINLGTLVATVSSLKTCKLDPELVEVAVVPSPVFFGNIEVEAEFEIEAAVEVAAVPPTFFRGATCLFFLSQLLHVPWSASIPFATPERLQPACGLHVFLLVLLSLLRVIAV